MGEQEKWLRDALILVKGMRKCICFNNYQPFDATNYAGGNCSFCLDQTGLKNISIPKHLMWSLIDFHNSTALSRLTLNDTSFNALDCKVCPHECGDLFVVSFLVCFVCLTKMSVMNSPSMGCSAGFLSCLVHCTKLIWEKSYLGCVNPAGLNLERIWEPLGCFRFGLVEEADKLCGAAVGMELTHSPQWGPPHSWFFLSSHVIKVQEKQLLERSQTK